MGGGGQISRGALQTNLVPRSPSHTLLQSSDGLLFICLFLGWPSHTGPWGVGVVRYEREGGVCLFQARRSISSPSMFCEQSRQFCAASA